MRPDADAADRRWAVRKAAREWFRVEIIDEPMLHAVERAYPDDRKRTGLAFRILMFGFTFLGLEAAIVLSALVFEPSAGTFGVLALSAGIAAVMVTEYLTGPLARRQGGIEEAVSFFAIVQLAAAAVAWLVSAPLSPELRFAIGFILCAFLFGSASWRWGYWFYAGIAAISLFLGLAQLPLGRILWVIVPLAGWRGLAAGSRLMELSPSLRQCCTAALAVCLTALYTAINLVSLDQHWVELRPSWDATNLRSASAILTALVPICIFIIGLRNRQRLLLNLGTLFGIASLLTLRYYVHVAPAWVVLGGAGAACLVLAAALRNYLVSGKNSERRGFSAERLLEDPAKRSVLETMTSVAALTPGARNVTEDPEFKGGGGKFGGGGASGTF
jgi:MFS family permease